MRLNDLQQQIFLAETAGKFSRLSFLSMLERLEILDN
jgi:hypothetical protein